MYFALVKVGGKQIKRSLRTDDWPIGCPPNFAKEQNALAGVLNVIWLRLGWQSHQRADRIGRGKKRTVRNSFKLNQGKAK
jgi:hypothetical protein